MKYAKTFLFLAALLALLPLTAFGAGRDSRPATGAVYAMSNAPEGNQVVVFKRNFLGGLTLGNSVDTGGLGSGGAIDPLGSQNSLVLSGNNRWLFAVNAGSNNISVFQVRRNGLRLAGIFDSGGTFPTSLAFFHNQLYVLNSGQDTSSPNITGFNLNRHGQLTPLPDSTRSLPGAGFHQVGFSRHGDKLIVTKGGADANEILVFAVDEGGQPGNLPTISPSAGLVPFGFIFDRAGHLLVSEAGSGAVTSYAIGDDNSLKVISSSVGNGNAATCWIAGTGSGAVFTANTGSDNISSYRVRASNGSVQLESAVAATGNKPIDMAIPNNGRNLYVINAAEGTVGAFRITRNGKTLDLGAVPGLPLGFAQGITAR